jgi:hypothetical protein
VGTRLQGESQYVYSLYAYNATVVDEQIHLVVRKPLSAIEAEIRRRYSLKGPLSDVALEKDALVLTFEGPPYVSGHVSAKETTQPATNPESVAVRKRRKRRVRNRMKTRGWNVVAKFVNSRGQSCTVYRPFYDALVSGKLKRREAYATVRDILVSNGNNPKPSSVEYFLNNTLEYIERGTARPAPSPSRGSKAGAETPPEDPDD